MTNTTSNVPPTDPRIIGFWTSVSGDYTLTNEYRADGTLIQHVGDRTGRPIPFQIEGECLICSIEQPNGTVFEQKTRFAISDETLTFFHSPRKRRVFRRTQGA